MKPHIGHWIRDYFYAARGHGLVFLSRKPPGHYLGFVEAQRVPVILIPGVLTKWHFLKAIADVLSLRGHPIYVVDQLGYNTKEIPAAAKLVSEFIGEKDLHNAVIIAHSKGGLIGKYVLAFHNSEKRVTKMIAIATPFGGSRIASFFASRAIKELSPASAIVNQLTAERSVNREIVSIFGLFDNHVWPTSNCELAGAKNIQVPEHGHHAILFSKKVLNIVLDETESKHHG